MLGLALPAAAQRDAAEKVQEGNVDNWVEYYRKQREAADAPRATSKERTDAVKPVGEPVPEVQGGARK